MGIISLQAFAAEHEWIIKEQFETFSLLADFRVDAQEIQTQLIELTSELRDTLGIRPTGEPIQIVLFESRKNFLAYLGSTVPTSRDRRAVFVRKGSLTSIYCYRSGALTTDLRHVQFLPLWMDEGLAEYFEESPLLRPTSSRTKSVRIKAAVGWSPDLDRLERIAVAGEMNSTDYRDSWALCSFLLNESHESKVSLRDYLQLIHDGNAPPQFSEHLKITGHDWQVRAKAYFRKPVFQTAIEGTDRK
jgi:hypothetical protein